MNNATTPEEQRLLARFRARQPEWDQRIGKPLTVRLSKSELARGTIVAVEPGDFHYTGRSVSLLFKVTMECGENKTRRTFQLSQLP